ncbi:MAG: FKBP-type peptidyl-prolyl cis-trans isomerase [Bacteroidales bacterium]|nr:FKBP-type peptidyl-prolyl cis-trans isomerase [Bacteroidales bacterium]
MFKTLPLFTIILIAICLSCRNEVDKAEDDEIIRINEFIANLHIDSVTENGIYYIIDTLGTGDTVKVNDFISINFCGCTIDEILAENFTNFNFTFVVGSRQVIKGIDEGMQLMAEGGTSTFIIPFKMAYYSPNSTFNNYNTYLFRIQLNEIIDTPKVWEINRINQYIQDNGYNAQPDTNGYCFIEIIAGTGNDIEIDDTIMMNYKCKLLDESILFSSESDKKTFKLVYDSLYFYNDTILNRALFEGLTQMKENGKSVIIIPSSRAYKKEYIGTEVPSYSTFIFEVENIQILK